MKRPAVEHGDCNMCGACLDICPEIFSCNDAGFISVDDVEEYPEDLINEAIALCPKDCICWEES